MKKSDLKKFFPCRFSNQDQKIKHLKRDLQEVGFKLENLKFVQSPTGFEVINLKPRALRSKE